LKEDERGGRGEGSEKGGGELKMLLLKRSLSLLVEEDEIGERDLCDVAI
jgi:hypothetical protein